MDEYLTVSQAAKVVGVGRQRMYQWIWDERIPVTIIAGHYVVHRKHCRHPTPRRPGKSGGKRSPRRVVAKMPQNYP